MLLDLLSICLSLFGGLFSFFFLLRRLLLNLLGSLPRLGILLGLLVHLNNFFDAHKLLKRVEGHSSLKINLVLEEEDIHLLGREGTLVFLVLVLVPPGFAIDVFAEATLLEHLHVNTFGHLSLTFGWLMTTVPILLLIVLVLVLMRLLFGCWWITK